MIVVLSRLLLMTVRGRIVRSLRMLRQPKYLIGSVIGGAWIGFWIIRSVWSKQFISVGGAGLGPGRDTETQLLGAILFLMIVSFSWLLPWGKLGLGLKEAELQLLLPAPVSRRQILQYAVLKNQIGLLIAAAVLTVFTGHGSPLENLIWFGGLVVIFNVLDLNTKLRGMFLIRQREISSAHALQRRAAVVVIIVGIWAFLGPGLLEGCTRIFEIMRDARGDMEAFPGAIQQFREALGEARIVLLKPFSWIVGPLFRSQPLPFLLSLPPLALVLVAQFELLVRSKARFEEVSMERAVEKAQAKSPTKALKKMSTRGRLRQPFVLSPFGPPEVAIVWKNLAAALRRPIRQIVLIVLGLLTIVAVVMPWAWVPPLMFGLTGLLGAIAMVTSAFTSGLFWRNDFRTELRHVELVRTWPVRAERLVMAEMLSPVLLSLLTSASAAGLVMASLIGASLSESLAGARQMLLPEAGTTVMGSPYQLVVALILLGALPCMAGVASVSSALQNLVVLFVPAWVAQGKGSAKGMAAFGNRMLFASALGLAFFFALIPSTLLVLVAIGLQWLSGIPWSAWLFPVWGVLAATPLLIGAYLIVRVAAKLWLHLDPAEELLEAAG